MSQICSGRAAFMTLNSILFSFSMYLLTMKSLQWFVGRKGNKTANISVDLGKLPLRTRNVE
jgi:hypothetical protein